MPFMRCRVTILEVMKRLHFSEYFQSAYELQTQDLEVISSGVMTEKSTGKTIQIRNGIPRFVPSENYGNSFGFQWNQFKKTQLDSAVGLPLSEDRFLENTRWTPNELKGKRVLEVGSGAGRFTEIFLKYGAQLVSFDYSEAVEANWSSNGSKGDFLLFQGDLYSIPFPDGYFDYVFCFGVLQHTPDPNKAYQAIFKKLKPGGKISIDYYLKTLRPSPWSTPKYFWRPIAKRLKPETLFQIISFYIPLWLPIDTLLRRIPKLGGALLSLMMIPCWNYVGLGLSRKQRLEWAILDTFDALSPAYDFPKTLEEVREMVSSPANGKEEVFYGSNGVVANVQKL